ncbi:hypothetical protein [Nocardiopsis coralliicola]
MPDPPSLSGGPTPGFVHAWKAEKCIAGEVSPLDFLDSEAGFQNAIAAAWLFCPGTVHHRGGVFLAERVPKAADYWIDRCAPDLGAAESNANRLALFDVFSSVGFTDDLDFPLQQLAAAVAECWQALLDRRHPRHSLSVSLRDEADGAYGPTVTFSSGGSSYGSTA